MGILSYIIWNASPEIFSFGSFALRWYGLFFALGFLISQQILYYMYRQEGKPEKDVDTLTIYMVIATILGARLGHVIFYQPEIIWTDPLGIFLPFVFKKFRFRFFIASRVFRASRVTVALSVFSLHYGYIAARKNQDKITCRC